jgi:hypothetical protein
VGGGARVHYTVNRPVSEKEKPVRFTAEPAGSPSYVKYMHGFRVGTGPVHVPGRTGSTGNRSNRSGSHRFREPWVVVEVVGGGGACTGDDEDEGGLLAGDDGDADDVALFADLVMPTTPRSLSLISLVLRKSKHLLHKHYKKKARSFIIYHIL